MRILFADDDAVTLETLGECARREGFEVILAANGAEALRLWREHRPVLVCLDVMMPHLDGFEVCRRIRKEDETLPVLFLSAKSEEPDVVAGLRLGADDFVRKPFGRAELLARIASALRRAKVREDQDSATFVMGSLTVEPRRLLGMRNGEAVDLTPREVSLLRVLHDRRGEAVSRDELLDACWGMEYYPESRTLDQHIAMLRKKVETDPARPRIIETVRGVGYRHRGSGSKKAE